MMSSELLPAFVHFTEYNISGPETNNDNDEMEVLSFEDMMMQAVTPSILKAPSTDNVKITPGKTGADHYSNNRTTRTPSVDTSSYVPTYSKPAAIDTKSWKSTTSAASSSCSWTPKSQAGSANINNRNNLPTLSQTPFTPASLSAVHILNSTKDIASKVTGKRPPPSSFLNDFDFPPVSMSNATTTTPSNHSSHKKHQSNNSYSRAPSTTNTSTTTPMTSTTSCYYNCSSTVSQVENVLFAPQQMTRQAFEERSHQWHYFSCDLQLEEIITQIDHQLEQIATESNEDDHHDQTLQSLYQQLYLYYQPFQYSWMIFQCQSIEQCELKIQVFRIRDDQSEGDYSGNNDQYDLSGVQLFLPQHYMITFEHIGGSQALFKSLFEKVKLAIGTYDDCWTKDLTVNVQSKCVLMSPTDYYYYQHHGKADPSGCSNTTTPNTSEKCRGEVSKKMNTSASEMLTMLTHAEFYADPTNITHLDEWISQILQYETKLEQYEAIRHLCQLCHAAHEEKKFLLLLEQLGLIEALMTVFIPAPTDTTALTTAASAVVSSEPVFCPIIADNDEVLMNDLYSIKPYVIQMLLYFTQREQPVRKMLNDKHFIAFLTSVVTNHNPQLSSFDASSATMSLKWMKLYRDCQRLSEELCKMIQTDDEVAEYDDGMMFSPKNNNNSHSHHHNGSNHQLKSKC